MTPHETLALPKSCIVVSLEQGRVATLSMSGFSLTGLCNRYSVKKSRVYLFTEDAIPTPSELLNALKMFSEENRLSPKSVTLSVPKSWVVVRKWSLPLAVEADLNMAITHEMDIITPFKSDEVYYDYQIVSKDATHIHFILFAVKIVQIKEYIDILLANRINVGYLTFNLSGLVSVCHFLKSGDRGNFIVLNHKQNYIEAAGMKDDKLSFVYSHELRESQIENALEVEKRLQSLLTSYDKLIDIAAVFESDDGLETILREQLENPIIPIQTMKLGCLSLNNAEMSVVGAAGAGLQTLKNGPDNVNFLECGKPKQATKSYTLTLLLIVVLIGLFFYNMYIPVHRQKMDMETLSSKIAAIEKEVVNVKNIQKSSEKVEKEILAIHQFTKTVFLPLDIIREVTRLIPKDSWVTRVKIERDQVEIEGYSNSATGLIVKLEESKMFQKVEFASPTMQDRRVMMDRFRIKAVAESQ
jgi:Tfp pilus assembly protein PilN